MKKQRLLVAIWLDAPDVARIGALRNMLQKGGSSRGANIEGAKGKRCGKCNSITRICASQSPSLLRIEKNKDVLDIVKLAIAAQVRLRSSTS